MRHITPAVGLTCAGALVLSLAGTAVAQDLRKSGDDAKPQRVVMECARDDATRRAFTREFGSEPVFITAREVQTARASGETWSAPRCMSGREHARLVDAMARAASVETASAQMASLR